jgi:phospholipid/cholesterol/gamma-HCH transport system substrate-binding protein
VISKRIVVNLLFFGTIGIALLVWAVTNVISVDAVDRPYTVTAEFDTSPGLSIRFEVTYLGQRIGSIRSVELEGDRVLVSMRIDRDVSLPSAVDAAVRRKSAVGEPYVDLFPTAGTDPTTGPRLAPGAHIPLDRTSTPLAYSDLFIAVDDLLDAVDPDDAATLLHELSVALDGRGESLRDVLVGAERITTDLAANGELLDAVVVDLSTLADTFAEHRGSFDAGIDDLALLSERLAGSQADLDVLLADGPSFGERLAAAVAADGPALGCTIGALGDFATRLDPATLEALRNLVSLSPQFQFVLQGAGSASEGAGGSLFFNNGSGAPVPVYDDPLPLPVPPAVPDCAEVLAAYPGPAADAPVAGAGTAAGAATPDGTLDDPGTTATTAVALPASSGQPGEGTRDLGAAIRWLLVLLAVAALVAAGRWTLVLRRRRQDGADA